jgi:hypothetical protein
MAASAAPLGPPLRICVSMAIWLDPMNGWFIDIIAFSAVPAALAVMSATISSKSNSLVMGFS